MPFFDEIPLDKQNNPRWDAAFYSVAPRAMLFAYVLQKGPKVYMSEPFIQEFYFSYMRQIFIRWGKIGKTCVFYEVCLGYFGIRDIHPFFFWDMGY